jgi:hypothetical protein
LLLSLLQLNLAVTARISFAQLAEGPAVAGAQTGAADGLSGTAAATVAVTGRLSWAQLLEPSGATINGAQTGGADGLAASAVVAAVITGRISWAQLADGVVNTASASITQRADELAAAATTVDPRVAGAWTPAMRTRFELLAGSVPTRSAALASTQAADSVLAAAVAIAAARSASAAITPRADALVAAATGTPAVFGPPDYTWATPSAERRVGSSQINTGARRIGSAVIKK